MQALLGHLDDAASFLTVGVDCEAASVPEPFIEFDNDISSRQIPKSPIYTPIEATARLGQSSVMVQCQN
jgi:hypothetical protein